MGHLTRKPTSNDPEPSLPKDNPWGTDDDVFHLLNMSAIRCCHCRRVVSKRHVTVVDGRHVFCPDHIECGCEICDHYNVTEFLQHNSLT